MKALPARKAPPTGDNRADSAFFGCQPALRNEFLPRVGCSGSEPERSVISRPLPCASQPADTCRFRPHHSNRSRRTALPSRLVAVRRLLESRAAGGD